MTNHLDYLKNISQVLRKGIDVNDFADSLSATQFQSKSWLVNTLSTLPDTSNKKVFIIGGWYGSYLVPMIKNQLSPTSIILNDINSQALYYAQTLHGDDKVSYKCFNAFTFPDLIFQEHCDIVINTSCEHMGDMKEITEFFYRNNNTSTFVFQTCNSTSDPGHINPKQDIDSFIKSAGLSRLVFHGVLDHGHKKRFMIVGQP